MNGNGLDRPGRSPEHRVERNVLCGENYKKVG